MIVMYTITSGTRCWCTRGRLGSHSRYSISLSIIDGYSTADIRLVWLDGAENSTSVDEQVKKGLPTFELADFYGSETIQKLSTGEYSRLSCAFLFQRNVGFYWIQIYQPCIMVVIISWVAFWINRDSAPARVTLGIMTVLTMTTLMTTTNRQMPKVSYTKAVDIYLGVCYVMVFFALLEYAAVSYSNKKLQDRKKKRQNVQTDISASIKPPEDPRSLPSSTAGRPYLEVQSREPDIVGHTAKHQAHVSVPLLGRQHRPRPLQFLRRKTMAKLSVDGSDKRLQMIASGIDKYSRIAFPGIFTVFNIVYWTVFLKRSGKI